MRFVLDASVAACWFFEDESSAKADAAFKLISAHAQAVTPLLFWFELRNAVAIGIRRNRITQKRANEILSRLQRVAIVFDGIPNEDRDLFSLVERHNLTFYDACYLELAARERIPLATLDQALARAAEAAGVALIAP